MNKKIVSLILLLSIVFCITSCSEQLKDVVGITDDSITNDNIFMEENSEPLDERLVTYYYYDRLLGYEKELYCIFYNNLMAYNEELTLPEYIGYDVVDRIFKYVMHDHPEIFWVDGYYIVEINSNMVLYPTLTMTENDIEYLKVQCDRFMGDMYERVGNRKSTYEICKAVYEYLVTTIDYADDANAQNMLSAMLNKRSVCTGFTKLYQYILNQYGIESVAVTGLTKDGTSHMWNMVKINGEYYYTDLTYATVNSSNNIINYDYFNVTTKQIETIYEFEAGQILYNCTATDASYYSQTGYIYSTIDEALLKKHFGSGLPTTIKCSNEQCYQDMITYLINEKHIYDYLPNQRIFYQTYNDTYKIEFSDCSTQ